MNGGSICALAAGKAIAVAAHETSRVLNRTWGRTSDAVAGSGKVFQGAFTQVSVVLPRLASRSPGLNVPGV